MQSRMQQEEIYNKETKMKKKLKIKFWKAEKALAMQILEQEGLPKVKDDGNVNIGQCPDLYSDMVELRGAWSHCDLNVEVI